MICPKCHRDIPDDAIYCPYCARVIVRQPQSAHPRHRPNGAGYAIKRGRTWTAFYCVSLSFDEQGKIHRKLISKGGFKTKAEALAYVEVLKTGRAEKSAPALSYYWDVYEKGELHALSSSKQESYAIAWKKLSPIAHRAVDTLTVQDLRTVVSSAAPTYYPARDMKVLLNHLFELAGADGWVSKELPSYIILPKLEEKERTPFSDVEQAALWKVYDAGDRRAAIPLIMIYTGMMPGEILNLTVPMVNIDAQQITGVGLKTKVRKAAPVYIPDCIVPILIDEIAHARTPKGYVWPHSRDRFYGDYYAVLAAAGCRRLEPYCCRHTTATALAVGEGIAPQTVRKIMRWSTTKMLDRYAHPDDTDAQTAINTLRKSTQ